jgi:hypothetical protein
MDDEAKDSDVEGAGPNDASSESSADDIDAQADDPAPVDPSTEEDWPEEPAAEDAAAGTDSASADAADDRTAEITGEPTTVRAAQAEEDSSTPPASTGGDRRVAVGIGAVLAALVIGGVGYAIGESSSSDLSAFRASPAVYRGSGEGERDGDRWSPPRQGSFGAMGSDDRAVGGDCPDRG